MVSPNLDNQKGAKAAASSAALFWSDQGIDLANPTNTPIITWSATDSYYYGAQDVQLVHNKLIFKTAGLYQCQFYCEVQTDGYNDLPELEPYSLQLDTSGTNSVNFQNTCNALTVTWETKLGGRKAVANFFIIADVNDALQPRLINNNATANRLGNCVLFTTLMGTQNFPPAVSIG